MTAGEKQLVRSVFGDAVNCAPVRLRRRCWFPLQPRHTVMAPCGHLHFHPASLSYRDDFSTATPDLQGLFIHEMVHVWQAQSKGRWYLPLMRHPFCRYDYVLRPSRPLEHYGIEQQAEIVRNAFLFSRGWRISVDGAAESHNAILPFVSQ